MKQIRDDLRRETVEIAIAAAEELLQKRMTDDDQSRPRRRVPHRAGRQDAARERASGRRRVVSAVARRYAKAILELGLESGTVDTLVREIGEAAAAFASSTELAQALDSPLIALEAKRSILTEIADRQQAGQLTKNTLHLLVDRRRIKFLPEIAATLREMNDGRRGLLRAEVTSATTLSDAYYQRLGEQLERMTGRKVALEKKTDPSLLGGVVTRIGDLIYDGSLRARLGALRSALNN